MRSMGSPLPRTPLIGLSTNGAYTVAQLPLPRRPIHYTVAIATPQTNPPYQAIQSATPNRR